MTKSIRGALYLSLAASIWGGMFVFVRIAMAELTPVPLVWLRYLTAVLALYAFGQSRGVSWHIDRRDWGLVFLVGFIGHTLSIVTQETGTMLTSAQMGSIITAATPAFMVVFARLLLGEALTPGRILSVVLATFGVLCIVAGPADVELSGWLGGLSLTIAAITWALMSVLLKRLAQYPPVVVTLYGVLVALVMLAPYSLWWLAQADWDGGLLSLPIVASVLYLGLVSTTGGFCLWNQGLLLMDASVAGLFFFLQPVVGTLLGWLCLDEPVTLWFWLGSALVVAGVLLAMKRPAEK